MGYLIFKALTDAQDYTAEIERVQGIPRPGTETWGAPAKSASADLWAVMESNGYPVPVPASAVVYIQVLPASWWGNQ